MVCVTLRAVEMSDNNTSAVAASPNALEEIFTSRAFRRIPLVAPRGDANRPTHSLDRVARGVAMVLMAICPCSMVARLRHGDYR
jgi:hypothetical protein